MILKLIGTSLWLSFSLWIPPIVSSKRRSILMKIHYLLVLLHIQAGILWLKMKVKIYPQPSRKQWRILKALIKHIKSNYEDLKEAQTLSTFLPISTSLQLVTKIWEAQLTTKPPKSSPVRLLSRKIHQEDYLPLNKPSWLIRGRKAFTGLSPTCHCQHLPEVR